MGFLINTLDGINRKADVHSFGARQLRSLMERSSFHSLILRSVVWQAAVSCILSINRSHDGCDICTFMCLYL
jgi:hypothetical protein